MTVGQSIQQYRKGLGMSQEELGQQLIVSRQTISLWEKDQTTPTIDNLLRLKEVFGVSVDDILGFAGETQTAQDEPNEAYRFNFSTTELNEIYRLQRKIVYKKPVIFALLAVWLIILLIGSSAPDFMIGVALGIIFAGTVSSIKGIRIFQQVWKNSMERISESTYAYQIFEDYIIVNIYRNNEMIRESKCYFTEIEQIQQLDQWLLFQFGGQTFLVRKNELKENSAFYSYMYQNPSKAIDNIIPNKWRVMSIVLFVASLLSLWGAVALVDVVSGLNSLSVENMWLFFLFTPIPLASVVFGFVLKAKGYKYKKNIIAGIIVALLLCIYGSFIFIF